MSLVAAIGIVKQQLVSQSAVLCARQIVRVTIILVKTDLHTVVNALIIS